MGFMQAGGNASQNGQTKSLVIGCCKARHKSRGLGQVHFMLPSRNLPLAAVGCIVMSARLALSMAFQYEGLASQKSFTASFARSPQTVMIKGHLVNERSNLMSLVGRCDREQYLARGLIAREIRPASCTTTALFWANGKNLQNAERVCGRFESKVMYQRKHFPRIFLFLGILIRLMLLTQICSL